MNQGDFSAREHVLGLLDEERMERAEERSLSDASYYQEMIAEEQLLVEDFAAGILPEADGAAFEKQLKLRPDLRERVTLERLLRKRPMAQVKQRGGARLLLALAASIAVAATAVSAVFWYRLNQTQRLAAEHESEWNSRAQKLRAQIGQLESAARQPRATPEDQSRPAVPGRLPPVSASFLILAYSRGGDTSEEQRFQAPAAAGQVELRFNIGTDNAFETYRILLRQSGKVVANRLARARKVEGYRVVSITLPAPGAGDQRLEARVSGISPGKPDDPIGSYAFILSGRSRGK